MEEEKPKKTLKNEEITLLALEAIADNTMCVREAVGVVAKIGETLIVYIGIIALGIIIPLINPNDKTAPVVCYGAIAIFGLYFIIHSLTLLSDLKHTVEDVSNYKKSSKKPFWKYF